MADAIISILAERVTAIIEDQIRYQVNLVRGVEKKVLDLSDKLEMVRNVLGDAEKRGVNGQSVKRWLKKFEDIAYEVDDILDEWNYALLMHKMKLVASPKHKVCCTFIPSSSCLCFKKVGVRRDTAIKIQNVKASLYEILKEKDDFNFLMSLPIADPLPKSLQIQSTSSTELENVYGLDIARNKNYIVKKLIFHGDGQIVSIVGMGGIGKTTLAQLVYNDSRVKDSFELRIWIYVSDPFDLGGIARAIVESVRKQILPPQIYQLEWVLEMLRDCIAGRTFLLVLDDVWTEDRNKWEPLKMNLKGGAKGSKILVTTRKEGVAKMMGTLSLWIYRPKQLSDDECWSLLSSISFTGRTDEECKKFEDMGKIIARKCNGLPLAANVLGSLLQFKDSLEEWENVSQSEIWELEKAEIELFPHLLLSYNELSPSLKRCFSYCALYPKDSRIKAERLIEEWMALGYLGSANGNARMEAKGQEYFNNLAMRSLFQEFKRKNGDPGEQIEWCKMHDTVHDFALFLRKDNERAVAAGMTKRSMLELKVLGRDFLGIESPASSSSSSSTNDVVVVAFPKLKSLSFDFCDGWSEWEDITAEEEESAAIKIMPCLTWLTINWCRGLEKLPHRLLRKASSLKMLDISHTPELQKNYGDMDNPSRKSICRNNPKQLDVFWVEMMHLFSSPCTQKR